jgi:putative ATP-binding cassette transporter
MPQKPYIPLGTLRRAATYPRSAEDFTDDEITEALKEVGLEHVGDKLDDEEAKWDRTLSGGEQQRLAFARLFLHKPDIVVMDEATSALDSESQEMLMRKLGERLPKTAIISVGHRPELEAFHERKVNLVRREGGAKLIPNDVVAPPVNVISNFMKRWRAPPAASPATPTAQAPTDKKPTLAA